MSEFKARCPKCGSGASLFKDKSVGWSAREGVSVLHCRTCGKQLYGEVADAEIARQYEERQAAPKVERPQASPVPERLLGHADITHRLLIQAREEAVAESTKLRTQAEGLHQLAKTIRESRQANSFDVKCVFNLIELDVASVRRLTDEIPQQTVRGEVERRLNDIRKRLRELPVRLETLRLKADDEAANRPKQEPAPQPVQTPNQPKAEPRLDTVPPPVPPKCAWKDCTENARPESLYCSTDCRIKNARWNYAIKHPKPTPVEPVKAKVKVMVKAPSGPPAKKPQANPDLESMSLDALRKYATHVLKVERASKIPGGKPVLLDICRKVIEQRQLSA